MAMKETDVALLQCAIGEHPNWSIEQIAEFLHWSSYKVWQGVNQYDIGYRKKAGGRPMASAKYEELKRRRRRKRRSRISISGLNEQARAAGLSYGQLAAQMYEEQRSVNK